MKPKYERKAKLCYIHTVYIKREDIDIPKDVETWFDSSNYDLDTPWLEEKNVIEKLLEIIALMKDELGWKIMLEFVALGPKAYSYLKYDSDKNKKANGIKRWVINKSLTLIRLSVFKVDFAGGC